MPPSRKPSCRWSTPAAVPPRAPTGWKKPRRAKPAAAGSLSEADEKLLNALYAVRKRLAGKQNLPAFMVFNDATLREMAEKKPMSIDELLNISGVGEKKAARYGNAFLRVIEDAVGSRE